MAYVINGGSQSTTEHFQNFIDDCCKAFNLLRKNCRMILNIIKFVSLNLILLKIYYKGKSEGTYNIFFMVYCKFVFF